jgi:hypothetical protein
VNALANDAVGDYLNQSFVSTFQKVGTFRRAGNQKQGGNVASYFCTPEGQVLHIVVGRAKANALLREARWVVEAWKLAQLECQDDPARYRAFFRQAHADRFRSKQRRAVTVEQLASVKDQESRVHLLLALSPMARIDQVYQLVFEKIVGEKVSTSPVLETSS